MVLRLKDDYQIDPADPRAPPWDVWERMSEAERARVVDLLPSEFSLEAEPSEGDPHNPDAAPHSPSGNEWRRSQQRTYRPIPIPVLETDALIAQLESALNNALVSKEEIGQRAQAEAERAQAEANRIAKLESDLAEAKAEIERLRRLTKPRP